MYGFSYTVSAKGGAAPRPTFIVSGSGDARADGLTYSDRVIAYQDTSPEGLREKVSFVVAEMERRLSLLGVSWQDAVSTQAYTVQNIGHLVGETMAARGALARGLVWHYARPPVVGLEYEMDVHGPARDIVI